MSFLQKVKQVLGIVGVKVEMQVDDTFSKTGSTIQGKVIITSKSDQQILSVEVGFEEVWRFGKGDDETIKTFDLGEWKSEEVFDIKTGETRVFPFTLNYSMIKSENDRMMESSKVGKALGGLGKMMDGEKSNFWLKAMADVKGAAFDPNCVKEMKPLA
jgi:hypothetical protein